MLIGFTGTRNGMSFGQARQLEFVLTRLCDSRTNEVHHGGARGADTECATLCAKLFIEAVAHRPAKMEAAALLARNREIVNAVDLLVAAPEDDKEELRSGTWATVRYARSRGIPVLMLSRAEWEVRGWSDDNGE